MKSSKSMLKQLAVQTSKPLRTTHVDSSLSEEFAGWRVLCYEGETLLHDRPFRMKDDAEEFAEKFEAGRA